MKCTFNTMAGVLCLLALSSGCSTWSKSTTPTKSDSWSISKLWKKEYQKPQTIAAIWSPDVLTLTGKPPTRGFGGRVYFYNERTQAVPVDGELIVHGYRKAPPIGQSEQVAADKTFAFTAEQLTGHFSASDLGASYSIWIPWDAADGLREEVTLVPTFKGTDGSIIQGTPAKLYLPGRSLEAENRGSIPTQSVSYRKSSTPTNPGIELPRIQTGLKTTTIAVPSTATLNRPRQQAESYTLGGNNQSSAAGAGITVGGGASAFNNSTGSLSPPAAGTAPSSSSTQALPTIPAQLGTQPIQIKDLSPPNDTRELNRFSSPMAGDAWRARSPVQPASYNYGSK
jgi:hypothetical protein